MVIKRADLWYYGTIGDKEYNSGNRIYSIIPDNNSSKEKIVIMGYQIGTGRAIKKGNNPNEYIEDLGELQITYKYINEHSDLEISWKWIKIGVQADAGVSSSPTTAEPIPTDDSDVREELSEELKILIATIYGEADASSEQAWEAIANVIMNRVGKREWKKYDTVKKVIIYSGFDAYTFKNTPYKIATAYLNNRNGKNKRIEKMIEIVSDVYYKKNSDTTNGSILYYSSKAQAALHKKYPSKYKETPKWNFNVLEEIKVKGAEKDDFKFYKYK